MESPCFNRETKTDCPGRKAGCAVNCPKWAEYTEEREKEYQKRKIKNDANSAIYESTNSRVSKIQVRRARTGWHRKVYKG